MKRQKYYLVCVLFVVFLAAIFIVFSLSANTPFGFVPDNAEIIRMPKRGWEVYVFQADPNGIMPEVKSELIGLGFKDNGPSRKLNAIRCFSKSYADGSVHSIEIYNKKLGSAGEAATAEGWISVSSYDDHYYTRRIRRFISKIKQRKSHNRNK